jgi:hypothetical protein
MKHEDSRPQMVRQGKPSGAQIIFSQSKRRIAPLSPQFQPHLVAVFPPRRLPSAEQRAERVMPDRHLGVEAKDLCRDANAYYDLVTFDIVFADCLEARAVSQ